MDKGDVSGIKVFAVIILILLVLIPVIIFSTSTPTKLSKSILATLGLGEKEATSDNDRAIAGFNDFKMKLIECSKYEQDNCLCDAPLNQLAPNNLLTVSRKDMKIEAVNDGNKVTLAKEDIENAACYFSNGKFSLLDFLEINFDEKGAYLDSSSFFEKNLRLNTSNIYKRSGNLCF